MRCNFALVVTEEKAAIGAPGSPTGMNGTPGHPGTMPDGGPGLRERKRRATRRLLEDAATTMVLDRGYDAVTIEDICGAAAISRRTFFNYFPTKDAAIFGGAGVSLSPGELEEIRQLRGTDPLEDLLDRLEGIVLAPPEGDGDLADPLARHRRLRERRRDILKADPLLAKAWLSVFEDSAIAIGRAVRSRLEDDPASRRLPDVAPAEEATIIVSLFRAALNDAMLRATVVDGHPMHDAIGRIRRFLATTPAVGTTSAAAPATDSHEPQKEASHR